jgi:hypothetical protein
MIEKSRTKALFLSRMTPLGEQIFPQGLCSVDFANSIRSFVREERRRDEDVTFSDKWRCFCSAMWR